ncbi:hypothetical protein [Ruminococcus flavefaciens]|uniref:Uncharacterized protein n=1 Tax=Ruminococcus flavefaciens TaxID=1265 RepID=A0A1M7J1D2_RUMFL|nr:hypothetical protein [Ruminococcus flavefaciens]SHM46874.1 hypothetical protein SAMN04487860_10578 [Ruminococcus flavefaciens]
MKTLKKVFIGIIAVPVFLIIFEIFGMIVNHASTGIQTKHLRRDIVDAIPNTEIISVESQTGNTSGSGNHVDCLTRITFSSDLSLSEVQDKLSKTFEANTRECSVKETDKAGEYLFILCKSAPFSNNIEGH